MNKKRACSLSLLKVRACYLKLQGALIKELLERLLEALLRRLLGELLSQCMLKWLLRALH
jgi:hypothetical protein